MVRINIAWKVYEFINKEKGTTQENIFSKFSFSIRKVRKIIKKLMTGGLIFEKDKGYYPISWRNFVELNNENKEV